MMKTVWVTGATGFLGGRVVSTLLNRGYHVIASGRQAHILSQFEDHGAQILSFDLADQNPPELPAIDAAVHCAALSSPWGRYQDFYQANVKGTHTALGMARQAGAKRFVHISTPSVYFRFRDQLKVSESQALPRPVNAYAATKARAEHNVLAETTLDPIILRPRGLYGRGDTALLPRLMAAARTRPLPLMNHGETVTDLTHVDDVVSAILAALAVPCSPEKRIFNISGGAALNLKSVIEHVGAKTNISIRWRRVPSWAALAYARSLELIARVTPGQPEPAVTAYGVGLFAFSQTLDLTAAKEGLNWTPQISFQEGLEMTFKDVSEP